MNHGVQKKLFFIMASVSTALLIGCSGSSGGDFASIAPVVSTTPAPTPTPTPVVASCPTNFVPIPADTNLGTSAFCAAKYEMKLTQNDGTPVFDGTNGGTPVDPTLYKPESRPNGIPWVRISHSSAVAECQSLGTGYHLITAKEHQAIARNAESVASNWSGNAVGSGVLYRGHSDQNISATAVADGLTISGSMLLSAGDGSDPYAGTGQSSSDSMGSGGEQRRTFLLTNGEVIWDIAGNARDKVDSDGVNATVSYTGPGSSGYYDATSATFTSMITSLTTSNAGTLSSDLFAPLTAGVTHAANLTGKYFLASNGRTSRIISRGGNWTTALNSGLFAGDFDGDDTNSSSSGGFRCAK